jgi:hypothetical protein
MPDRGHDQQLVSWSERVFWGLSSVFERVDHSSLSYYSLPRLCSVRIRYLQLETVGVPF